MNEGSDSCWVWVVVGEVAEETVRVLVKFGVGCRYSIDDGIFDS